MSASDLRSEGTEVLLAFSAKYSVEKLNDAAACITRVWELVSHRGCANQEKCQIYFIFRISRVEESALRELRKLIYSHKDTLLQAFRKHDTEHTGEMLVHLKATYRKAVTHALTVEE